VPLSVCRELRFGETATKKDSLCQIIGPRATSTRFHPKAGLVGERLTGRKPFFGQRFSPLFPPQTPPFSPLSL
jgi:hypothetical protein